MIRCGTHCQGPFRSTRVFAALSLKVSLIRMSIGFSLSQGWGLRVEALLLQPQAFPMVRPWLLAGTHLTPPYKPGAPESYDQFQTALFGLGGVSGGGGGMVLPAPEPRFSGPTKPKLYVVCDKANHWGARAEIVCCGDKANAVISGPNPKLSVVCQCNGWDS